LQLARQPDGSPDVEWLLRYAVELEAEALDWDRRAKDSG